MSRPVTPVSILAASLAGLVDDVGALDPALGERVRAAHALAAGLDGYVATMTTPPSPALAALARRTDEEDWAARPADLVALESEMLSGHVEGQLLRMLVQATGARSVLEVGMFTGYSALAMAEALPDDGTLVACELDAAVADFARDCLDASPAGRRVEIRVGPAADTLRTLAEAGCSFDLVFVDADKPGYLTYLTALLDDGLLAADGLLCVDNTLMQGEPWLGGETSANGGAIAAFNAAVADDPRVEQVVLPVRDGLTLIRRVAP